jgi:hypothetical protein
MFKRILAVSLLLPMASETLANGGTMEYISEPASGFYIGGDIGGDSVSYKPILTLNENATILLSEEKKANYISENFNQALALHLKNSATGIDGGVFVGYKFSIKPTLYVALEGFGDLSSNKKSWSVPFANTFVSDVNSATLTLNNMVNLSTHFLGDAGGRVRAGISVNPINSLYVLAGFSEGFFRLQQNSTLNGAFPSSNCHINTIALFDINTPTSSKRLSESGFQIGGGWERLINHNIGIRIQYAATFYKRFTLNTQTYFPPNSSGFYCENYATTFIGGSFSSQLTEKPTVQQFTFGVFHQV